MKNLFFALTCLLLFQTISADDTCLMSKHTIKKHAGWVATTLGGILAYFSVSQFARHYEQQKNSDLVGAKRLMFDELKPGSKEPNYADVSAEIKRRIATRSFVGLHCEREVTDRVNSHDSLNNWLQEMRPWFKGLKNLGIAISVAGLCWGAYVIAVSYKNNTPECTTCS